jgi:hypothetical protein
VVYAVAFTALNASLMWVRVRAEGAALAGAAQAEPPGLGNLPETRSG